MQVNAIRQDATKVCPIGTKEERKTSPHVSVKQNNTMQHKKT
jgi:hypothetical protein